MSKTCCVFTRGEFFMRDAVSECADGILVSCVGEPFRKVGNVSSGLIEIDAEIIGRENQFNLADPASRNMILGVNLSLSLNCASDKNLILSLLGQENIPVSGLFSQQYCPNISSEMFVPFEKKGVDASSVQVVLNKDLDLVFTLVEGLDYLVSRSGVQFIRDDIDIQDANILNVSYFYDETGYTSIEFNQESPKYKEIYFKGTNFADEDGEIFDAIFYRVLFAPISQMDLITRDEFLTLNLAGKVEKKDGRWFNITKG